MREHKAFLCDFCDKVYLSKSGCRNHEKICFFNPETYSCVTCRHINYVETDSSDYPNTQRVCDVKWRTNRYGHDIRTKLTTQCKSWEPKIDG